MKDNYGAKRKSGTDKNPPTAKRKPKKGKTYAPKGKPNA